MLKVFAHLLADSQREARGALVQVVELQVRHFSEERKSMASIMQSMERAMARMQRQVGRFRIATDEEPGADGADADTGGFDVMEMLGPLIAKKVRDAVGGHAAPETPKNGAAAKE